LNNRISEAFAQQASEVQGSGEKLMDSKPQVLVVDDDLSWQETYQEALEGRGYEVQVVGDKASALSLINRRFLHAAIVDLRLGEDPKNRDGLEVLRHIWALDEGTRVIVGSGYVDVSMFDEFQRMGIFSFTELPAEARRQIRSIEFFDGVIKKSDPLQKILGVVDKAVAETWRRQVKQQWISSPFKLIPDVPAREVQRLLRAGKLEELRPFLSQLVRPLFPWLPAKTGAVHIQDGGETLAFEVVCWSRSLGKAVAVRFGRHADFQKSLALVPVAANLPGAIVREGKPEAEGGWPHVVRPPFEGRVYELEGVDFAAHFDPPPHKKD
jgi:ActR/RegA family two-component response regulator